MTATLRLNHMLITDLNVNFDNLIPLADFLNVFLSFGKIGAKVAIYQKALFPGHKHLTEFSHVMARPA